MKRVGGNCKISMGQLEGDGHKKLMVGKLLIDEGVRFFHGVSDTTYGKRLYLCSRIQCIMI